MRLTFWVADAKTGTIIGRLPIINASFQKGVHGGSFTGDVVLEALTDTGEIDWDTCAERLDMITPLERTIVVTGTRMEQDGEAYLGEEALAGVGRTLLGEWPILWRSRPTHEGTAQIRCNAWEDRPSAIAQDATINVRNVNPVVEAMGLLERVFFGVQVDVRPPAVPNPVRVDMERRAWSGQIADAIAELQEQDAGFEWLVGINPVWDGEDLVSVERVIAWGIPEYEHAVIMDFEAGEWGSTQGNCAIVSGGEDGSRWVRRVQAVGAGEGSKQLIGAALTALPPRRLDSTKTISASTATTQTAVDQIAAGELARSQSMWDPITLEVDITKTRFVPLVGTRARLVHMRSPAWPGDGVTPAIDQMVRVGQVNFRSGREPVLERVTVAAVWAGGV